jgi:subtilisin family serine protease
VLSNSWGGGGYSAALEAAINDANASNMLFVAAAGNAGRDIDSSPSYPASYSVPNVVAVAATTNQDVKASFSNWGATTVHLAAPGQTILSTILGGGYQYFNGTSMATPHVSGAAALVLSRCALSTANLKNALLTTVDVLGSLTGLVATNGRLNVDRAVRTCGTPAVPLPPTGLTASPGDGQVTLNWSPSTGATSYKVKRSLTSGGPYTTIASGIGATNYLDSGLTNGLTYFYVVSAVNSAGESANSAEAFATPAAGGGGGVPLPPENLTAVPGDARVSLAWLPSSGATSYKVRRSLKKSGGYSLIGITASPSYTDLAVTNGVTYWYVVRASNSFGTSRNSNKISATPNP